MERVAEAFGVMMLETGLFQADAHPGNILVMKGAALALSSQVDSLHLILPCNAASQPLKLHCYAPPLFVDSGGNSQIALSWATSYIEKDETPLEPCA
jgi:hypothetical protein